MLALLAAREARCLAIVALAPPFPEAITGEYRRWLERGTGWLRREVPPPPELDGEPPREVPGLQRESARVTRKLLEGWPATARASVPTLVVGGTRDHLLDLERLRAAAGARGCQFAEREAGHWDLWNRGFERYVDPLHRWLVRVVGEGLLRLTGTEDLEDEEER